MLQRIAGVNPPRGTLFVPAHASKLPTRKQGRPPVSASLGTRRGKEPSCLQGPVPPGRCHLHPCGCSWTRWGCGQEGRATVPSRHYPSGQLNTLAKTIFLLTQLLTTPSTCHHNALPFSRSCLLREAFATQPEPAPALPPPTFHQHLGPEAAGTQRGQPDQALSDR